MAGRRYIVSGDPTLARNTVYSALQTQGFTLTPQDEWSAIAERGSKGASMAFGAMAGKAGRHVKFNIHCQGDGQGNTAITLIEGTSGWSGGIIGTAQASSIYSDIYNAVAATFQNAGVLLFSGPA